MIRTVSRSAFSPLLASIWLLLAISCGSVCQAQMVTGSSMPGYGETLGLPTTTGASEYAVHLVDSSIPGNILWPGGQPVFTIEISNPGSQPIQIPGHVDMISYGTRGAPGDVWTPHVFRIGSAVSMPVAVTVAPDGFQDIVLKPKVPARFGGYALVLDLGSLGRQFITSFARSLPGDQQAVEYPHMSLDSIPTPVLQRLGIHAIRLGIPYKPTTDSDFASYYADLGKQLKAYHDAKITVLFMIGGGDWGGPAQPLAHQRPWLDDSNTMLDTKFDIAWLPSYDSDFQEYCHKIASDYGWPKGPINAFSLWNEPWEGISISGWGADMLRYRDMYRHMWQGVNQARQEDGVTVLVGGTDSSSNAWDKLFPDNSGEFVPMFDFLSLHYQGLTSTANYKPWVNRKGYGGRVKLWDTESWVGNTDDRVAGIVAGDRAAGYDRALGVFGGNICQAQDYNRRMPDGTTQPVHTVDAYSTAASVGAASYYIGERPFQHMLFSNGLPWVMVFGGQPGTPGPANPEDGTVVVVGDLGEEFGAGYLPFRTARGYAEMKHKAELRSQLAAASGDAKQTLLTQLATAETLSNASMTLHASNDYSLYDFYGNSVVAHGGKIVVPLDGRGFFLRGSGRPGSFAKLLAAIRSSDVEGIEPLAIVAHDMTAPTETDPTLRLTITNVLNRPVKGPLMVVLDGLTVAKPRQMLDLLPNETREVDLVVTGKAISNNTYPMHVSFDAAGLAPEEYTENMHANVIAQRSIVVDGNLDDWKGVIPQTIVASGADTPTLTQKAWLPFQPYDTSIQSGLSTAYLAYDDQNFYFAAKVADNTPYPGTVRYATRDDDQYFYPQVSYLSGKDGKQEMDWPAGVRRYSYRENPDLPAGNFPDFDNIQIAFNVLPQSAKRYYPTVPGTMSGFVSYQDTDYEYALNPVAPKYGGGTEVWCLAAPGIPPKHFYPRQPKVAGEGAVTDAQLVIRRDGDTLIYECAIPWSHLPEAKRRIDHGQTVKFSYRVNNNTGGPVMELSKERSVAKRNGSFHVDWVEHWANELEFGAEKAAGQ